MKTGLTGGRRAGIAGSFPSLKLGQSVPYLSSIERDLLFFLEFDIDVVRYQAHPFLIEIVTDEHLGITYTPSFQVIRSAAQEIVGCFPAEYQRTVERQKQAALAQAWADEHNHDFVIVTDVDLRAGHRLANLNLMWRYRFLVVPLAVKLSYVGYLKEHPGGIPLRSLTRVVRDPQEEHLQMPWLYNLLFYHLIEADLSQPLTSNTLLFIPSQTR